MNATWRTAAVLVGLAGAPVLAQDAPAQTPPREDARAPVDPPEDGGTRLSPEDAEVVQNLDLLQHLDESRELDTLVELSDVDSDDDSKR